MIYCLKPELYPTPEQTLEEISYRDENDFEWKIARVENEFSAMYFGKDYLKISTKKFLKKNRMFMLVMGRKRTYSVSFIKTQQKKRHL